MHDTPPEVSHSIGGSQVINEISVSLREVEDDSDSIDVKIKIYGNDEEIDRELFKLYTGEEVEIESKPGLVVRTDEYALITLKYENVVSESYIFKYDLEEEEDPYWTFTSEEIF